MDAVGADQHIGTERLGLAVSVAARPSTGNMAMMWNRKKQPPIRSLIGEGIVLKFSGNGRVIVCSRNRSGFLTWLGAKLGLRKA